MPGLSAEDLAGRQPRADFIAGQMFALGMCMGMIARLKAKASGTVYTAAYDLISEEIMAEVEKIQERSEG